jgi:hypothetical protein
VFHPVKVFPVLLGTGKFTDVVRRASHSTLPQNQVNPVPIITRCSILRIMSTCINFEIISFLRIKMYSHNSNPVRHWVARTDDANLVYECHAYVRR